MREWKLEGGLYFSESPGESPDYRTTNFCVDGPMLNIGEKISVVDKSDYQQAKKDADIWHYQWKDTMDAYSDILEVADKMAEALEFYAQFREGANDSHRSNRTFYPNEDIAVEALASFRSRYPKEGR